MDPEMVAAEAAIRGVLVGEAALDRGEEGARRRPGGGVLEPLEERPHGGVRRVARGLTLLQELLHLRLLHLRH